MASGIQWGHSTRSSTPKDTNNLSQSEKAKIEEHMGKSDDEGIEEDRESTGSEKSKSMTIDETQEESLKSSVENLRTTIDRLTVTLASVDTRFKQQDAKINYLENI